MSQHNQQIDVKKNLQTVQQMMAQYKDQIAAALPKHLTPDRMARIAMTEIRKSSTLSKANPLSLLGAIIQASQLGLEPGSALGHCYLVPYKGEIQLQIGYRGMIELARRSAQVLSIAAHVVYEGDQFSYQYGLREELHHVPCPAGKRGKQTHVYATAKLVGGGEQFVVLEWDQIIKTRNDSEGYKAFKAGRIKSTPWDTHVDEMACKTAVRRLFKFLPVSIEVQRAVSLDEQADYGNHQNNASIIDADFLVTEDDETSDVLTMKDQIRRTDQAQPEKPAKASLLEQVAAATTVEDLDLIASLAKELSAEDAKEVHAEIAKAVKAMKG